LKNRSKALAIAEGYIPTSSHGSGREMISRQAKKSHSHDSTFEGRTAEIVVPELSESIVSSPPN
jgi:hypothetical protein